MANRTPVIVLSLVALGAVVWGGKNLLYSRGHVVTDNAQVDGRLLPIASKVQGFINRVPVEDNQVVKAGDTLLVLDARDLDARVAQARADLDAALAMAGSGKHGGQLSAQLTAAQATAAGSGATVQSAEVNVRKAKADLDRIRGLAAKQIVAAQQLDAAQASYDAASATLEATKRGQAATLAQVGVASAALTGADARVASARAALETAQVQRGWAVIVSPMAAIITKRTVEPGALLQPGQTAMMLVPIEDIWVTANVKETKLGHVAVGDTVEFTVDSYGDHQFRGTVESLSPATGAKFALLPPDNATGNFTKVVQNVPVRIAIVGPLDPKYPLRPGMSVDVSIRITK
ncbi:MAG: HlyD family secretion protein [Gemmatimonadales bacterium]